MSLYIDNVISEGLMQHESWCQGLVSTITSASTLTLTATSPSTQIFTGSTNGQVVKLPDATTFSKAGFRYKLINDSTQNVAVQNGSSTQLFLLGSNQRAYIICTDTGSVAGGWTWDVIDKSPSSITQFYTTYPGSGLSVNYAGGIYNYNGVPTAIAGGTIALPDDTTGGWLYVDIDFTVKATASLPANSLPLYQFTTAGGTVTVLTDMRQDIEDNEVWGVLADIVANTYSAAKSAGTSEKYARADHSHGGSGVLLKSGSVTAGSFAGNPKTYAVVFNTAMPSANYNITITGTDTRSWSWSGKTSAGFTINSNANQALTGNVDWQAILNGESV